MGRKHFIAILQALFVTILWSSSWLLIKVGLDIMPAITFAGLRYTFAGIILMIYILIFRRKELKKGISTDNFVKLLLLGIIMYFLTQGAQYLGLYYLPAVQVSLFLNFTPVLVMAFATSFLNEKPTVNNIIGVIIFLVGVMIFFLPLKDTNGPMIGYIVMVVGVFTNAFGTMLGRDINKRKDLSPILVTTISMLIGGILLLLTGFAIDPMPVFTWNSVYIILVLAIVNTAFAFTLWNYTMQELTSVESSIINNTMLIQIAILSWLFLDESLSVKEMIAIMIAATGAFLVQYKKRTKIRI